MLFFHLMLFGATGLGHISCTALLRTWRYARLPPVARRLRSGGPALWASATNRHGEEPKPLGTFHVQETPWVKTVLVPFWGMCATYFRTYFSGDWDVHRGYGVLTHSHMRGSMPMISEGNMAGLRSHRLLHSFQHPSFQKTGWRSTRTMVEKNCLLQVTGNPKYSSQDSLKTSKVGSEHCAVLTNEDMFSAVGSFYQIWRMGNHGLQLLCSHERQDIKKKKNNKKKNNKTCRAWSPLQRV